MDDFKLLNLDDFDREFKSEIDASAVPESAPAAPVQKKNSLIPEIEKPVEEEPVEIDLFAMPEVEAEPVPEKQPEVKAEETPAPAAAPAADPFAPVYNTPAAPPLVNTPPAPLYESEKMSDTSIEPFIYNPPEDYEEDNYYDEDYKEKKTNKGALAGKIIAIVLLVSTVVVFICGCFVAAFLDNPSSSIGGTTFSTLAQDNEKISVSKGSLIIAKKVLPGDYQTGDLVAVPSSTGEGCDIMYVNTVAPSSEDSCLLTVSNTANMSGGTVTYESKDTSGKVNYYIPAAGGLIRFAMQNAILVIILFILLAALWCLIIILIDKSQSGKKTEDIAEEEQDGSASEDNGTEKAAAEDEENYDEPVFKF